MIDFDELRIKKSEVLNKEKWNGLLDDTRRNFEGNVGLGVDAPIAKLSLGPSLGKIKLALYQNEKGTSYYGMGITAGHFYFNIGNPKAKYAFLDRAGKGAQEIFTIKGNGNVGIGFTNPTAPLHVNGIIKAKLRFIGDKKNVQYNTTTGEIGYDNSTRRDKRNITPLEDDFAKIMQLQPRKYTRPDEPGNWEIGYIAEEAKSLGLDHLVYYDEKNRPDGINYRKLCLYLVEIVREHERRLNPGSRYLKKYVEDEAPNPA